MCSHFAPTSKGRIAKDRIVFQSTAEQVDDDAGELRQHQQMFRSLSQAAQRAAFYAGVWKPAGPTHMHAGVQASGRACGLALHFPASVGGTEKDGKRGRKSG